MRDVCTGGHSKCESFFFFFFCISRRHIHRAKGSSCLHCKRLSPVGHFKENRVVALQSLESANAANVNNFLVPKQQDKTIYFLLVLRGLRANSHGPYLYYKTGVIGYKTMPDQPRGCTITFLFSQLRTEVWRRNTRRVSRRRSSGFI